jgi:hypothetical protein
MKIEYVSEQGYDNAQSGELADEIGCWNKGQLAFPN